MGDDREKLTLTLHGLPAFNKDVDGEAFARKFFKFMQALAEADKQANGERRSKYLIDALEKNTATARVREMPSSSAEHHSGVRYFRDGVSSIYYDRPAARRLSLPFVNYVRELSSDVGNTFAFGEIKSDNQNTVRIDEGLRKNADKVAADIRRISLGVVQPFAGEARASFDGTILALDSRKDKDLAVIRLTAGGREIECKVDQISDDDMVRFYKKRCTIFGVGHYSGNDRLPDWIQVAKIELVEPSGSWGTWKAAFPELKLDEWH
ncbi:hypothetical protein [Oricola indica]|uniref:hypothetical protein n=1 Tax=Oricola indica TaxID=2872591 RepID=UPI003CCB87AA